MLIYEEEKFKNTINSSIDLYLKKLKLQKFCKDNIDINRIYKKYIYTKIVNSQKILKLLEDNDKRTIIFTSKYEYNFAVILKKINRSKSRIILKKNTYEKVFRPLFFFFYYILCNFFLNIIFFKESKNKNYILLFTEEKLLNSYLSYFKGLKNFSYINYKKISFSISLKKIFNSVFAKKFQKHKENEINIFFCKVIFFSIFFDNLKAKTVFCFEGDDYLHELFFQLAQIRKIKSVCIQWSSFITKNPNPPLRNISSDYLFVWGKKFKDEFKRHYNKKILISGNPRLEMNKSKKKNCIVFLFQGENSFTINEDTKFLKLLNNCIKFLPHYQFILRLHPFYKKSLPDELGKYSNVLIHYPEIKSLHQSIKNAKFCVSIKSSVIVESSRYGIVPLLLNEVRSSGDCYHKFIKKIDKGLIDKNIQNLQKKIIHLSRDQKKFEKYSNKIKKNSSKYFNLTGNVARKNIKRLIEQLK